MLYDYSDWRLPTKGELLQMYQDRYTIGGFGTHSYWSSISCAYPGGDGHYIVSFYDGYGGDCALNSNKFYVRPVRVEN